MPVSQDIVCFGEKEEYDVCNYDAQQNAVASMTADANNGLVDRSGFLVAVPTSMACRLEEANHARQPSYCRRSDSQTHLLGKHCLQSLNRLGQTCCTPNSPLSSYEHCPSSMSCPHESDNQECFTTGLTPDTFDTKRGCA